MKVRYPMISLPHHSGLNIKGSYCYEYLIGGNSEQFYTMLNNHRRFVARE